MTIVTDPETGKKWPSMKALAASKGINIGTFRERRSRGKLSLEMSLFVGNMKLTPAVDHLGNRYASLRAMADAYGVKYNPFLARINLLGWPLEEALTTPVRPRGARRATEPKPDKRGHRITINGVEYASVCAAAKAHGLSPVTVYARLRHKCTPEQAVRPVSRGRLAVWYKGRRFSSKASLAASLGISSNDVEALEGLKYE